MSWLGLLMFVVAGALIVGTGLPVYALLLAVATLFAVLGIGLGAFEAKLFYALPSRLVGLLEHDLLQALPLYALIGALLNRLPLAGLLQRGGERLLAPLRAAPPLAALGVGALLAPMNGSVGASLHMLGRRVAPALREAGVGRAETLATVCVASTLGVVVPPSLVLLLLGDAMMRAHTEAANLSGATGRIVNTQDVLQAVLLPGLAVLLVSLALVAWRSRRDSPRAPPPLNVGQAVVAGGAAAAIVALLGLVAVGRLYAVEAAATGAIGLLAAGLLSGQLKRADLKAVLADAMSLTGLLFALLVGATTFSLVVRGFGTDLLVGRGVQALADQPSTLLAAVLGGLVLCSFVLDAFEMIFLVVPLVMPPLLAVVPDAAWVAALTLLVLQLGFLLPPLGYAVVMARGIVADPPSRAALAKALGPQLVAQLILIVTLLFFPRLAHWNAPPPAPPPVSSQEAERLMDEAFRRAGGREADGEAAPPALPAKPAANASAAAR